MHCDNIVDHTHSRSCDVPGTEDYWSVPDHTVRSVLQDIFERKGGVFSSSLKQVSETRDP